MYIDTLGRGPDVTLVHGMPQDPADLRPLAEELAGEHRVHVVHLPGYGRTPPAGPISQRDVAARMAEALEERGVTRTSIVGSSAGFLPSAMLATGPFPLEVVLLVGLGSIAEPSDDERAGYRALATHVEAGVDLRDTLVERMLSATHRERHPESLALARRMMDATSPANLANHLRSFADAPSVVPDLATSGTPILMRTGGLDEAAPPHHARALAERLPHARVEIVDGCGHLLLVEDWWGTVASLRAALQSPF